MNQVDAAGTRGGGSVKASAWRRGAVRHTAPAPGGETTRSLYFRTPGLRREAALFVPAALTALLVLSVATLFLYRQSVAKQLEVRRGEALRLADMAVAAADDRSDLMALPWAAGVQVSLVTAAGELLTSDGPPIPLISVPANLDGVEHARAYGPGGEYGERIVVVDRVSPGRYVLVQVAVPELAAEQRRLGVLTPLVLAVDGLLALLIFGFVRHAFRPWGEMVRRAEAAGAVSAGEDEVAFLMATFDRALAALAAESVEPGLAALRDTLGEGGETGLLLLSEEGRLLAANGAVRHLTGAALAIGEPIERAADAAPGLLAELRPVLAEGCSLAAAELELGPPETRRVVALTVQALKRADGGVRGYLILLADVTEPHQRAARERLAEGLASLGEMAAGVAHELRNSLATLSGYLQLVERRAAKPPEPHHLDALRDECRHLERVVEDFLAFAQPGTARPQRVDLAALARRVLTSPDIAGHDIELDNRCGGAAEIEGDPHLLARAISNLVRNALAAQPREDGVPVVRLENDGDRWILAVLDRGPGVPTSIRGRLFQPFVSGRAGGTGMGLSVAQRIATLHGGRIELVDREGGGTRAELRLPGGRFE